jgi:hypothetical protein
MNKKPFAVLMAEPVGFANLSAAVRTINLFWELVELPGGHYEFK